MKNPDPVKKYREVEPSERHLIARLAAHESWARTPNRTARTAPARDAFLAKFEHQVDPDGVLDIQERTRRADSARKAHFARLALRSAQARRGESSRRTSLSELADATSLLAAAVEAAAPPVASSPAAAGAEVDPQSGGDMR